RPHRRGMSPPLLALGPPAGVLIARGAGLLEERQRTGGVRFHTLAGLQRDGQVVTGRRDPALAPLLEPLGGSHEVTAQVRAALLVTSQAVAVVGDARGAGLGIERDRLVEG